MAVQGSSHLNILIFRCFAAFLTLASLLYSKVKQMCTIMQKAVMGCRRLSVQQTVAGCWRLSQPVTSCYSLLQADTSCNYVADMAVSVGERIFLVRFLDYMF